MFTHSFLKFFNFCSNLNSVSSSKNWTHACASSSDHPGPWEQCAPSSDEAQSILTSAKKVKLRELVGEGTGRGTRGWGCGGAQWGGHITQLQVVHPLLCFFFSEFYAEIYFKENLSFVFQFILPILYLSSFLTDESTEEESSQPLT